MSTRPHYNFPGVPQLVLTSTARQEPCFFVEKDYLYYLDVLQDCADEFQCHIHSYALMPDHIYLLVTPHSSNGLSHMMQSLSTRYVSYVQKTYGVTGSLWQGRYKSCLLECESYLLNCMRFIEEDPVREKRVEKLEEYRWSSFLSNALQEKDSIITPHSIYLELSRNEADRLEAYKALFNQLLDENIINEISETLNSGMVLGTQNFKDKVQKHLATATGKADDECFDCIMYY